ncbi:beta-2-glycoprotein 1 isoform X3 [Zalophus californianus]|uniref:Beta-2-glycoprotein 1 n=1 Tax=Zalophus californianus TaxID=9704 RepID=A0A6J2FP16_ZALCA|nr:beta-2-glycoprotein 1 isoform X3 [Zalophus californianus]
MISLGRFLFSIFLCHVATAGRTCPKPDILPFATVVPLKTSYDPGEEIVYSCHAGYVSRGGMRRFTCPLTGLWPINTLRCTPRICPFAGILENGAVRYTTFEYPNTISFACNTGFYLNGSSSARCTEEGKWNVDPPVCTQVKCPFPSRPDNGFVKYPAKQTLYYKDKAIYDCHDTFVLDGPQEVECSKFGNWSAQPSCKASCKLSVKKATVLYQGERVKLQEKFKDGMPHGEKVSFFCKNKEQKCSYTMDAQCIDGTIEIPKCFKERNSLAFWKTDASDVKPC